MKHGIESAIRLALQAHANHRDKAGQPYILHCVRVMLRMESEEDQIVAVLHDTGEHTKLPLTLLDQIRQQFGDTVADAVAVITRRSESYEDYIERCSKNDIARRVKLADLADNLDSVRLSKIDPKLRERLESRYRAAEGRLNGGRLITDVEILSGSLRAEMMAVVQSGGVYKVSGLVKSVDG